MKWRSADGIPLGSLFGIRFYLDYSWFLIAALVTWKLARSLFPAMLPGNTHGYYLAMALAAALVFFVSILLHELGHSLVSQRCGIPVPRITLLFIGGIARLSREPDDPRSELKIAAGGPAVSIVLALLYAGGAWLAGEWNAEAANAALQWLAAVNIVLVLFNALPGYPLDGGRILRAILWARTGDLRKATRISARIGICLGCGLVALGAILVWRREWNAFTLMIIGIFLVKAARAGRDHVMQKAVISPVMEGCAEGSGSS